MGLCLCLSVCLSVSVRLSQVGFLSKRLNDLAWELSSTYPTLCCTEIRVAYIQNKYTFFLELHWLKVSERIQFRLCVLEYRCLIGTAPSYLAEILHVTADVGSRWRLRSASTSRLLIRGTSTSVIGHFGPQSLRSFFEDRTDRGPK